MVLTTRDKAYVRAVAHGDAHDMYKGVRVDAESSAQMFVGTSHDRYTLLHLDNITKTQIHKAWHILPGNSWELQDLSHDLTPSHVSNVALNAFSFPKAADSASITKSHQNRYGDNVFLDSTHLRVRISLPQARYNADEESMCRFIVFRSKEKQSNIVERSLDHSNPHYDLFLNADGYEQGLNGLVNHADSEEYLAYSVHANYGPMSLQNFLINKKKYVVMKDCKFNLGKDFGTLGFETTLHWDWNDRMLDIPHLRDPVTDSDDGDGPKKNYSWYMLVMMMNPTGGSATQTHHIEILGTTKAKSTD